MHDSTLTHLMTTNPTLRLRVEALTRKRMTAGSLTNTERAALNNVPLDALMWEVAANPSIFGAVKTALDPAAPDVEAAVNAVPDGDLDFVIVTALPTLG